MRQITNGHRGRELQKTGARAITRQRQNAAPVATDDPVAGGKWTSEDASHQDLRVHRRNNRLFI